LSILDIEGGHQPMVSEHGRTDDEGLIAIVFNGCIYNHRDLRAELEKRGHTFATDHSDTESLIHAYREWGESFVDYVEGMYAFALWDRNHASLMLARDWFGEKPLYVRVGVGGDENMIAFASDARGIARLDHSNSAKPQAWAQRFLQLGYN